MNPRMILLAATLALALFGGSSSGQSAAESRLVQDHGPWICPPCGSRCDQVVHAKPGRCSTCGMQYVLEASVPSVGVLLFEGVDLLSIAGPAGILSASNAMRVFTVADSTDPIPTAGLGEIVPMRSFADTPPPDVLIIPSGRGVVDVAEDELVMDWVVAAVAQADQVLVVGLGGLLLGKAGAFKGHQIATDPRLTRFWPEAFTGVEVLAERQLVRSGKFTTVSGPAFALDGAFGVLQAIVDEPTALRTAKQLGFSWEPDAEGER